MGLAPNMHYLSFVMVLGWDKFLIVLKKGQPMKRITVLSLLALTLSSQFVMADQCDVGTDAASASKQSESQKDDAAKKDQFEQKK